MFYYVTVTSIVYRERGERVREYMAPGSLALGNIEYESIVIESSSLYRSKCPN